MSKRILAFDIGIKNLAWCCADIQKQDIQRQEVQQKQDAKGQVTKTIKKVIIQGWANENLITGGTAESDATAAQCKADGVCTHKANYVYVPTGKAYCSRHCPPLIPALRDLSGTLLKKLPKMPVLRAIAVAAKAEKADLKTKAAAQAFLEKHYCVPRTAGPKVKMIELEELHNGMQDMVARNAELWSTCDEILLENQPVFKNPVMKSVQMMLFATLRDLLEGPPKLRLVHAGRKTAGATGGDEGYAERKSMSEARVSEGFKKGTITSATRQDKAWFESQAKRSDLADCLCMVWDVPL